jgi:hypothetical protein
MLLLLSVYLLWSTFAPITNIVLCLPYWLISCITNWNIISQRFCNCIKTKAPNNCFVQQWCSTDEQIRRIQDILTGSVWFIDSISQLICVKWKKALLFCKWKMTSILQYKTTCFFFFKLNTTSFFKWKRTSIFLLFLLLNEKGK